MHAVIRADGKQYKVAKGDSVFVGRLEVRPGGEVILDEIILANDDKSIKIGTPAAEGTKVVARIEKQDKGREVVIFKYEPKRCSHIKYGHRQPYTKIAIESTEV